VIGGDAECFSIAAASILAKVTRDRAMRRLHLRWPAYGFAQHVGYPTAAHRAALAEHGPSPHHRRGFAPVDQAVLHFA
jgi:ribonuclease HII